LTTYQRRQVVNNLLKTEPGIRVQEIARRLNVSEGTIRNDLNALAISGELMRVRGGAVIIEDHLHSSPAFATRARQNAEMKDAIARYASSCINHGDSILLDASTTVYAMARHLQDRKGLRVVTNGIEVARLLASNPSNIVILLGGVLRTDGASITGSLSEKFLRDVHISTAYVSCSGFDFDAGLTEVDIHEAQLKEIAIRSAANVIALIDTSKFGKIDLTPFARPDQITHIYTDVGITQVWQNKLVSLGVPFTICRSPDLDSGAEEEKR
jgi:DeoR/GlpR family transcriptional regulator of sugar metabolism